MSTARIVAADRNLINEVASSLRSVERDYSSTIVVFPGKRPAHFLRKELANRAKGAIIPPRIYSFDLFVEYLFRDLLGGSQKLLDPLDAVALLYDVHLRLAGSLGGDAYRSFDQFLPLALRLIPELEEVTLADATARKIREGLRPVLIPKFHSLADYFEAFYQEVADRGFVTRATMTRVVADGLAGLDVGESGPVILAGFYAFTNAEGRIVRQLLEREQFSMIVQSGPGLKSQLAQLGIEAPEATEESPARNPAVHFHKSPDIHGQVAALARLLQQRVQSGESLDERIAIVLPDAASLFPTYHGALSLFKDDQFNIALGYPLDRTPICGLFMTLLELASETREAKFTPASYLRVALHPYIKSIRLKDRTDLTRMIMHAVEVHLQEYSLGMLFRLEDLEQHPGVLKTATAAIRSVLPEVMEDDVSVHLKVIHDRTIRPFLSCESLGVFADRATDLLNFIFDESTARYHPLFLPYAEEMVTLFERMKSSLLSAQRFSTPQQYLTFFRHAVKEHSVPFSGTPLRGIQVLGLLETRNLRFDTIYMLAVNDDVIPGKPGQDMLLPQKIRRMLGLETHTERERLKEYYFALALSGTSEAHLFYTEREGGREEKSRFVEKLLWEDQKRRGTTLPSEREFTVRYRVNLSNPEPGAVRKTDEMIAKFRNGHWFGASQLDDYLRCPLRFYYRHVLKLSVRENVSDEIDRTVIGTLVHDVLKVFFESACNVRLNRTHLDEERLENIIDTVARETFGKALPIPIQLSLRQVSRQLRAFIRNHQMSLIGDQEVVIQDLEKRLQVEKDGYRFAGRVDRIERRGDRLFILDYKTGNIRDSGRIRAEKIDPEDTSTWQKGIGSLQLPFYTLLYAQAHAVSPEHFSPRYLHLGRNKIDEGIEVGMSIGGGADTEAYRFVEPLIFKMIDEIVDIGRDFYRTSDLTANCPVCPYQMICGTHWMKRRDH